MATTINTATIYKGAFLEGEGIGLSIIAYFLLLSLIDLLKAAIRDGS